MQIQKFLAIVIFGNNHIISEASYSKIAGYAPGSKVTSHNAIDLDQKALENALGQTTISYTLVKNIYEQGGNSKTYAEFSVPALETALKKGDKVVGSSSGISGKMYSNYDKGATKIKVAYPTSDDQATYVDCKKGALLPAPQGIPATAMTPYILDKNCFQKEVLTVTTHGVADQEVTVTINPDGAPTNKAGRTLKGFSTKAGGTMYTTGSNGGCAGASDRKTDGCPYKDFSKYYEYYGDFDYANKMVLAAIDGKYTSFAKDRGQMDLSSAVDDIRSQIIKKGTAYMNAYMYAIREFEDAIDDCKAGCPGGQTDTQPGKDCNSLSTSAVHAWDEGVAFYTGSLEGADVGGNSNGKLSYRLAEKRCGNFKTCGPSGSSASGVSYVNTELFKHLDIGKNNLLAGKCEETRPVLTKMVALMSVPLIQGTLRYAYKVDKQKGGDKEKGEGAIFAAAIVPAVSACSSSDADTIMSNMKIGATATNFAKVKTAFENNHACLGITCAHVGGLWSSSESKYYESAEPCVDPTTPEDVSQSAPHPGVLSLAKAATLLTAIFGFLGR